ncbi:hypothetical protein [Chitinophaga japonensis]|uniref:Uncharacterized protein n=1 Tax=Chitinophaga japonensis TaxID=104662 RepID=A0A562SS57_CHIJA|nr:hypothetical protein [Chitinophaga japonensis]TWI83958.1 hypothetical protein LX66_4318 [Chitinophaga japonensis]
MAHPNVELIAALRETARRLKNGAPYAWGNHGTCNCGNLLQVITRYSKEDILRYAHTGMGEWTELAEDYCVTSNAPVGLLISRLMEKGLTPSDIHNIEYLQDRTVLEHLPGGFRWLKRNQREDVILYMETFATLLEERLLQQVKIPYNQLLAEPALTFC